MLSSNPLNTEIYEYGQTFLFQAVQAGKLGDVKLFLDAGHDINRKSQNVNHHVSAAPGMVTIDTPLLAAAASKRYLSYENDREILILLLTHPKIDLNNFPVMFAYDILTCLEVFSRIKDNKHVMDALIKSLLAHPECFNPDLFTVLKAFERNAPLIQAINAYTEKNKALESKSQTTASLVYHDVYGKTFLFRAVQADDLAEVRSFLNAGHDVNRKSQNINHRVGPDATPENMVTIDTPLLAAVASKQYLHNHNSREILILLLTHPQTDLNNFPVMFAFDILTCPEVFSRIKDNKPVMDALIKSLLAHPECFNPDLFTVLKAFERDAPLIQAINAYTEKNKVLESKQQTMPPLLSGMPAAASALSATTAPKAVDQVIGGKVTFVSRPVKAARAGTSSIVERIVEDSFHSGYAPTRSIEAKTKALTITPDREKTEKSIILHLRDMSSQQYLQTLVPTYCRDANAIVFIVDSTVPLAEQEENLRDLCLETDIPDSSSTHIPFVVITKIDLTDERQIDVTKNLDDRKKLQEIFGESVEIVETSAKTGGGIPQLTHLLAQKIYQQQKPVVLATLASSSNHTNHSLSSIINLFNEAIEELQEEDKAPLANSQDQKPQPKSNVFINQLTCSSGKDFKAHLMAAKNRMITEVESGRITAEKAHQAAAAMRFLAFQVATCTVTAAEIKDFSAKVEPAIQQSTQLCRIFGGLMVAALGVFIGMMIGAAAGPVAAFAALTLAEVGATSGAVIGGLVGGWLGSKFSLWAHPLSKIENAAYQVVEKIIQQPGHLMKDMAAETGKIEEAASPPPKP